MYSSRVFSGCRALMAAAGKTSGSKTTAGAVAAKASGSKSTGTKSSNSGIMKLMPVSPELSKFLGGVPEASYSSVIKKVWEYIKANDLQNPSNKREICCDEKLKAIFQGKDTIGMLQMPGLLSPHFIKAK